MIDSKDNVTEENEEAVAGDEEKIEETSLSEISPSTFQQYSIPISIVVAGIIVGVAIMMSGGGGSLPAVGPDGQPVADVSSIDEDDDAILGDPNAPVMIVEFSDFQCPFCRRFWRDTLPLIQENYIDTGKVSFVYRDFPLSSIHPDADLAAEAAECAGEQGFYWQAHDIIFAEQELLGEGTVRYTQDDIENWFRRIPGLDVGTVSTCIASGDQREEVAKDLADGRSAGVSGTPGFIVAGQLISGALPYTAFEQILEAALAAE